MLESRPYAGFWLRIIATTIDFLLALIVFIVLLLVVSPSPDLEASKLDMLHLALIIVSAAIVVLPCLFYLSASPGKLLLGLSVIDLETGKQPSVPQHIIRFATSIFSIIPFMLGIIWIAFDKRKQGLHDKLAKTAVINSGPRKKIFVNYRQKVSLMQAGRVSDKIASHFGYSSIFHDKSSLIGGSNWKQDIENSINQCAVMVVVIGDGWLTQTNPDGGRRLDDPNDYVAMEIATALERKITVIPVLVDNAPRLYSDSLPDKLKGLAFIEPIIIRNDDWNADINKIINAIYLHTDDPRKIGWRNFTSLGFSVGGMMYVTEDVVAMEDAIIGGLGATIGIILSLSSYMKFKAISSPARSWSIGLLIFSLFVLMIAITDS